jgi:hypothetical protein
MIAPFRKGGLRGIYKLPTTTKSPLAPLSKGGIALSIAVTEMMIKAIGLIKKSVNYF